MSAEKCGEGRRERRVPLEISLQENAGRKLQNKLFCWAHHCLLPFVAVIPLFPSLSRCLRCALFRWSQTFCFCFCLFPSQNGNSLLNHPKLNHYRLRIYVYFINTACTHTTLGVSHCGNDHILNFLLLCAMHARTHPHTCLFRWFATIYRQSDAHFYCITVVTVVMLFVLLLVHYKLNVPMTTVMMMMSIKHEKWKVHICVKMCD